MLAGAQQAHAQAGIGVTASPTTVGTIGTNKGDPGSGAISCPAGSVMTGIYHADHAQSSSFYNVTGMTAGLGVYCSTINVSGGTATLVQLSANGTPTTKIRDYPLASNPQNAYCGAGRIGVSFGGWDRLSYQTAPWTSAVYMECGAFTNANAGDWFTASTTNLTEIVAGTRENNYPHNRRGPFCGTTENPLVTGLYGQAGGSGYDGVNVYCGNLVQARFSAQLTFTNFNWDQTAGPTGWRVNLNRNGTLLQNSAGMSGANKTPYSAATPNNAASYVEASEVYVIPNGGYQATLSGRPAAITNQNSFIVSGNCAAGIALENLQDAACQMTVTGRPDLAVSVTNPPNIYRAYNAPQNLVLGVKNVGPASVATTDGYAVTATLPTGWTAQSLPTGCTQAGQVVRCVVGNLAASTAPNQDGGTVQFTVPVVATTSANGAFDVSVALDATVPTADANPANDDFNNANNTATGRVELIRNAVLRLSKQWSNAVENDTAVVTATTSGGVAETLNSTANTPTETDTSTGAGVVIGAVYSLSETLGAANVGAYSASAFTCTGGSLSGSQLTVRAEDSGRDITCSITNTRRSAEVRVTKTSTNASVRAGENIVWNITVLNNGPDSANNAVLRDQPGEGMDCAVVPPACTATNGASCPASLTLENLTQGVPIPQLPNGGQVTVTLTCRATASGV